MNLEDMLADISQSLKKWDEDIGELKAQVAALREENADLREQLTSQNRPQSKWLSPEEAYPLLGHKSRKALYDAIDNQWYKSGTEIQRRGGRSLLINVEAIEARFTREQTKKRVC